MFQSWIEANSCSLQLYYLKATGVVVDTKDSPHKCGQKESKENQTASDEEGTDEGSEGEDSEDESDNEKEEKYVFDACINLLKAFAQNMG